MKILLTSADHCETLGDLLRFFYRKNCDRKGKPFAPLKLILNPRVTRYRGKELVDPNTLWVIYEGDFFLKISEGESPTAGPHAVKLLYQIKRGGRIRNVWIATAQVTGSMMDKKDIRRQLRIILRKKKFFLSEKRENEIFLTREELDELVIDN